MSYAAAFAPDATHIGAGGELERGREEIATGHETVLSTWGRASRKSGRVDRLRFLTADVAMLTVYGDIMSNPGAVGAPDSRTIETITARRTSRSWDIVACQHTPLGHPPRRAGWSPAAGDAPPEEPSIGRPDGDEAQIRALYQDMLDCWLDAPAYAQHFTHDADYITGGGLLERGWRENVEGHQIIFSAWARDSRLAGRIDGIRFLTADVAVLTAYGHIVFPEFRGDDGTRTIYTSTVQKLDDRWIFVGYQNTPLAG